MDRSLLHKESKTVNCALKVGPLFSDTAYDYFSEKVDNYKMLANLYWETILSKKSKPTKYLIIGDSRQHQDFFRELNNRRGIIARLVSPHPWEFLSELEDKRKETHLLASGLTAPTELQVNQNDLTAINEIWPETTEEVWQQAHFHMNHLSIDSPFLEQLLVAEKGGAVRIKRSFFSTRKDLAKSEQARFNRKSQENLQCHESWGHGICNINFSEPNDHNIHLHHLRYTSETLDFFFAKNLVEWFDSHSEFDFLKGSVKDSKLYISASHSVVSGFLMKYFNQHYSDGNFDVLLPDVFYGRNFATSYFHFLGSEKLSVFIDMNFFPDIYVWKMEPNTDGSI